MSDKKQSLALAMSVKKAQMKRSGPMMKDLPEMPESPKSVADAIMMSRKKMATPELEPTFEEQEDEMDPLAYEPGDSEMEIPSNEKPESDELDRMSRVDKIRAMMKARRS